MAQNRDSPYTPSLLAELERLWLEVRPDGTRIPVREIASRLRITPGQVTKKVRRLKLPPRPNPVDQSRERPKKPVRIKSVISSSSILPSLFSEPLRAPTRCCWPIGDPGKQSFHFCNARSVPGKPYCQEHVAIAYVKVEVKVKDIA